MNPMARFKFLINSFVLYSITVFIALPSTAASMEVRVAIDKSYIIELDKPASTISVANPEIADVTVTSPTLILIVGKAIGATIVNIINEIGLLNYDVFVLPSRDNEVTVNLGSDSVLTLQCQPRCVRVGNPGLDPSSKKGGSKGGAPPLTGLAKK